MELDEAKRILGMIAGRKSGVTTVTLNRDAARVILDHLAELRQEKERAEQKNGEADRMQAAALLASDEQERLFDRLREAEAVIEAVRQMLPRPMSEPLSRDFTGRPFPRIIDGDTVAAILSRYKPTTENGGESNG